MKHCKKCNVDIAGDRKICPLCHSETIGEFSKQRDEVFPLVPTIYKNHNKFFRTLLFLSIAVVVIAFAVNILIIDTGWWSLSVLGGVACLWIILYFSLKKRRNIPKTLLYQLVLISVFCVLWDFSTGWKGWSIDFVIPILIMSVILSLAVLSKVLSWEIDEIILYFCIVGILGIVPIIFYLVGALRVPYPSIICVACSVITLAAILIFRGENIINELKRRFYM